MRVRGLDGREYVWKWANREVRGGDARLRSVGHVLARKLLAEAFPFEEVLEEVPVPGCPWVLYFDFVVPRRRLAVEVQGEQHRRYVPHFHATPRGFVEQQRRDAAKVEWCDTNNIRLVIWHDDRTDDWGGRLRTDPLPGLGGGE